MLTFNQDLDLLKKCCKDGGIDDEDWVMFCAFAAAFFMNCGNFCSSMNAKFVPEINKRIFRCIIFRCEAHKNHKDLIDYLISQVEKELHLYQDPYHRIGFKEDVGVTSFYSSNINQQDAIMVQKWCE